MALHRTGRHPDLVGWFPGLRLPKPLVRPGLDPVGEGELHGQVDTLNGRASGFLRTIVVFGRYASGILLWMP